MELFENLTLKFVICSLLIGSSLRVYCFFWIFPKMNNQNTKSQNLKSVQTVQILPQSVPLQSVIGAIDTGFSELLNSVRHPLLIVWLCMIRIRCSLNAQQHVISTPASYKIHVSWGTNFKKDRGQSTFNHPSLLSVYFIKNQEIYAKYNYITYIFTHYES